MDQLDGLWSFVREPPTGCFECESLGVQQRWFVRDLSKFGVGFRTNFSIFNFFQNSTRIPVPSAYNDLFAEREVREHVGWVWYQHEYRVPRQSAKSRLVLRFGSVQYRAKVVGFKRSRFIFCVFKFGHCFGFPFFKKPLNLS